MSFDIPENDDSGMDRFANKDLNFSISWLPSLKDYYQLYLKERLARLTELTEGKSDPETQQRVAKQMQMKNPCFVFAHEIYDALPIHQFELN